MQMNAIQYYKQPLISDIDSKLVINRTKRKSRWKLKFHHQALPPEYLDHYEASLHHQRPSTHAFQKCPSNNKLTPNCSSGPFDPLLPTSPDDQSFPPSIFSTVRYKDLPYMGEMTLDNARPRRGRKPKKADICHLIYKNYGTTVVDEPLNLCLRDLQNKDNASNARLVCKSKSTCSTFTSTGENESVSMIRNRPNNLKIRSREICKRRSRRSMARDKLEKTFKERGFLIQTQQLESDQGATYCKFRQLRKFTRYLFRNWRHHLPGDMVSATNSAR